MTDANERFLRVMTKRRAEGKRLLVTYLCVGDPSEAESIELALACVEAGADVLELGAPFSDPSADGPAIARASERALAKGGGLEATLRVARAVRDRSDVPIVLFGYYNPLFVRGEHVAIEHAAAAGVDALLVVDLPLEEAEGLREAAASRGLGVVPLVATTTTDARIAAIGELGKRFFIPFVYSVSMAGVTGAATASEVLVKAGERAAHVQALTHLPTVVGFGIDGAPAARLAAKAAGVVVGSAIVRQIEAGPDRQARCEAVKALVRSLRESV
jgi:tryptophan synthase alpha chain